MGRHFSKVRGPRAYWAPQTKKSGAQVPPALPVPTPMSLSLWSTRQLLAKLNRHIYDSIDAVNTNNNRATWFVNIASRDVHHNRVSFCCACYTHQTLVGGGGQLLTCRMKISLAPNFRQLFAMTEIFLVRNSFKVSYWTHSYLYIITAFFIIFKCYFTSF